MGLISRMSEGFRGTKRGSLSLRGELRGYGLFPVFVSGSAA